MLLLTISAASEDFPTIHGPVITELGADPVNTGLSADAAIFICSFNQSKSPEIYANTGYGFELKQSLEGEHSTDITLSRSGSKVMCNL